MALVEQKKDQLDSMLRLQNYLLECAEIKSQIQDKRKAIDATQYVGSDLGGVLALQRRLSTMEGALSVLEPKLLHLQVGQAGENDCSDCTNVPVVIFHLKMYINIIHHIFFIILTTPIFLFILSLFLFPIVSYCSY